MQTDATLLANNSQLCWMLHVAFVCTPCCVLLGVVAQSLKPVKLLVTCKRTQQPPTMLRPFARGFRLRANGRNNSQHCCANNVGSCCVRVGRAVQTDPTLLRFASAITEQKKCGELLPEKFDRFQTLRNNTQQHPATCNRVCKRTQHVTFNNVGSCWPTMLRPFARGFT